MSTTSRWEFTSTTEGLVDCHHVLPMPADIDGRTILLCPRCAAVVVETEWSS